MIRHITELILRDLDALAAEIDAFERDDDLWRALPGTSNPPGALALHLCGNLQHFVGAALAATGYERDRPAEFAARDLPRTHVRSEIGVTRGVIASALPGLAAGELDRPYPLAEPFGERTTAWVLMHLAAHLSYHLGQINYARRYFSRREDDAR